MNGKYPRCPKHPDVKLLRRIPDVDSKNGKLIPVDCDICANEETLKIIAKRASC